MKRSNGNVMHCQPFEQQFLKKQKQEIKITEILTMLAHGKST
jgi:hypothetical protein